MELLEDDLVSVNLEDLPSEMTTVVDRAAEVSLDSATEVSQGRTNEFEEYTAQAREVSRTDVETRHHSVSQEREPEALNAKEDIIEPLREATSPRLQAAWVTKAVAACQANKKVRFQDIALSRQDKH